MGNCMKPCTLRQQGEEIEEETVKESGIMKESGKGGMKIKIVLTKEEVELLLLQLKVNGGKLGDVLGDIEKGREKYEGWRPSLESIMEGPEELDLDE